MRSPKEILLSSRQYACEERWRSWWHFLTTAVVLAALMAAILLQDSLAVRIPCGFLLGLVLVRLFIIYHDFQHGAIFRGSRLARWLLRTYGLLVLNPPSIWRRSHDHHHRNNSRIYGASIGSFPVMTRTGYARATCLERLAYRITRHPLNMALGYLTVFFWGMCVRSFLVNPRLHADSALSVVLHGAVVVTLSVLAPAILIFLVLLPMTVASALGAYLFYAQHNFPQVKLRAGGDWDFLFAALHSSSFIRMGPIMRWFMGNIGYHHVHHLNARIPFYRLPEAMAGMVELQSPGTTTLGVVDIWRCLRLKLWDVDQGRMISFREAV